MAESLSAEVTSAMPLSARLGSVGELAMDRERFDGINIGMDNGGADDVDDAGDVTEEAADIHDADESATVAEMSLGIDESTLASSEIQDESELLKYACPVHKQLYLCLKNSKFLSAVHVRVRNESYWYQQRSKLGPKRHNVLLAKQNQTSGMWESSYYKMKPNDDYVMVPQKQLITTHNSRIAAFRKSEVCCKERDECPTDNKKTREMVDPTKLLDSHFRIQVVSARFYRISNMERVALVWEELLKGLGQEPEPKPSSWRHDISGNKRSIDDEAVSTTGTVRSGLGTCPPLKFVIASTYGPHVCALPVLRIFLPVSQAQPQPIAVPSLTLIIETRTPSQWRPADYQPPDSERFGPTHLAYMTLEVPQTLQPKGLTGRVKQLAVDPNNPKTTAEALKLPSILTNYSSNNSVNSGSVSNSSVSVGNFNRLAMNDTSGTGATITLQSQQLMPNNKRSQSVKPAVLANPLGTMIAESLGVDKTANGGVRYRRVGGIYGHFFRDMDPKIRELVMSRFKENKQLIQREGNHNHNLDGNEKGKRRKAGQPMTTMARMRAKMEAMKGSNALAEYDKGTSTEQEMLEEVFIQAKKLERVAVRLQRIRRITVLCRAAKIVWWRQYAALRIQKVVRGHYGRLYVRILQKLRPIAATRVQRCFRGYKSRQIIKIWRKLSRRLTRVALPKIKRFLNNCFRSWLLKNNRAATVVQAMIRMFIAKTRHARVIREEHLVLGPYFQQAATQIQRVIRGRWGRLRHARLYVELLTIRIDTPAVKRIQRIYRGYVGRIKASQRRTMINAANRLQRFVAAYVRRVWDARVAHFKLRETSATQIQRIARGRIDRAIFLYKYKRWRYLNVFIPAVIMLQATGRGYNQRQRYKVLIIRHHAAKVIQRYRRRYLKRMEVLARWLEMRHIWRNSMAAKIQAMLRGFFARRRFKIKRRSYESQVIFAVKKIMRCWFNYKASTRLAMLLDEKRLELFQKKILKIAAAREETVRDVQEIKDDIVALQELRLKLKARLLEVDTFLIEADMRIPAIQQEMYALSPEDFEKGWAEAYGNEYDCLVNQHGLAKEEVRLLKAKMLKQKKELLQLALEQEEYEIELHNLAIAEIEAYEGLRRSERLQIDRKVKMKWQRDLRRERCHWKTDAVRRAVIRRNRPGYQDILRKAREGAGRDMAYAKTINFEKRQQVADREEIIVDHLVDIDGLKSSVLETTYESYAGPIQETYDKVTQRTLAMLRDQTLDYRATMLKEQYKAKEKSKKHLKGGQFAPLKEDFQGSKRAFDYLRK